MVGDSKQQHLDFNDAHSAAKRGLQVVSARFLSAEPVSWHMFDGFDRRADFELGLRRCRVNGSARRLRDLALRTKSAAVSFCWALLAGVY